MAYIYFKRLIRWRRNSAPYLSGDAFADLSDYVYNPPRWRNFNQIESPGNANVIFCRSHELQEFLDTYSDQISAKVIITGNSDFEFHEIPKNIPETVKALFLQNSYISDNKRIFTLPIGLENYRLGVNGNPRFIRFRIGPRANSSKVLFGPLSPTHPIRKTVIENFGHRHSHWDFLSDRLSPKDYDRFSGKYGFIAAVRGNGVDTHRLWEALYRGITPIVEKDNWWLSLEKLFPQVLSIQSWKPNQIESLLEKHSAIAFEPKLIDALWIPYWESKILRFTK